MNAPATTATSPPPRPCQYDHTQRSPIPWLVVLAAAAIAGVVIIVAQDEPTTIGVSIAAVVLAVIAFSFHWLRIADDGDALVLRFGPVPLFRKRIPYAAIVAAAADTTTALDGVGIHWLPRRGWTYNIWGFDCVRLTFAGGRTIRVGTDDTAGLARFLQQKCAPRP